MDSKVLQQALKVPLRVLKVEVRRWPKALVVDLSLPLFEQGRWQPKGL
jgi:hypothetical protein